MATAVADRTWRDSSPEAIEADLAALWSDLARQAPVVRSLMANLVIFRERPSSEHIDLSAPIDDVPVDEVCRLHPSRVILLHHARGGPHASCPVAAAIGALTFGPPRARYGIEQIAVRSTCAEASLPSIVRRLTLGDLPTSLWWTEDLSEAAPLAALVAMARQFVYDSRRWHDVREGVLALAPLLAGGHRTKPCGSELAAADTDAASGPARGRFCTIARRPETGRRAYSSSPRRRGIGVAVCGLVVVSPRVHVRSSSAHPCGRSAGR